MTWDGVPFAIDGANHPAEILRAVSYAAAASGEGVVGGGDCKVTASAIPDANIHVSAGAVVALNRFPGGGAQSYVIRNDGDDEVVALTPQGASGVRYDLIAVIVQDPAYAGQPAPVSDEDGPFVITKVYEDVDSATNSLADVDPDQSGYALALVKFNASDAIVSAADITDLRELALPRSKREVRFLNGVAAANLAGAAAVAPTGASWSVFVPSWADRVILEAEWVNLKGTDSGTGGGAASGTASVTLGAVASTPAAWGVDAVAANKPVTFGAISVVDAAVPDAARGTVQTLQALLAKTAGSNMTASWSANTSVKVTATFYEALA